jgi:hypothetical protein
VDTRPRYWFPAKTFGWGWGLPVTWQGWLVLLSYLALVLASISFIRPALHPLVFAACIAALTAVLTIICWCTGEPPQWRWGKR